MRLPHTLLAASLALAVVSLPVESQEVQLQVLTPDDFKDTIANGVWFIEHFSPYCGHCRQFAPTWKQLVDEIEKTPDPGIHLAQVNCAVNGDLCTANGVKGYPQMNLYKNGEFIETWHKARNYDDLLAYLRQHAEPSHPHTLPPYDAASDADLDADLPPAGVDPNPHGEVLSLNSKNFYGYLSEGPLFVKFFAPWCGHCKKLAPHWTKLAEAMKHRMAIAEVDCEAEPKLCKQQGVTGYPMLYYYEGGEKTEYVGGRKIGPLQSWAEKAAAPSVLEITTTDELDTRLNEDPVVFLALHSGSDKALVTSLQQAASSLLGSAQLLLSSSPDIYTQLSLPASSPVLLVLKDGALAPTASLPLIAHPPPAAIKDFLTKHKLPTALELTQETFQSVMSAPHRPLVVLAAVGKDDANKDAYTKSIKELARAWLAKEQAEPGKRAVVFTWMDADRWASWLKSMYGIQVVPGAEPPVVITDHAELVYWDTDARGAKIALSEVSLFSAIEGALSGTIAYNYSENIIERFARRMNKYLTALESNIFAHPLRTLTIFVLFMGALFYALKRWVFDDISDLDAGRYNPEREKQVKKAANRLD
ncbi:thioredoxin-like protein [Punctularia strigosozonata HHB-11173 SS5]|uniref:Thioredoxin-like protein n=1 Tax=Punctularia strigosozonata (strain HHB-11173) TaxID=741275 RepID=R7S510_PUNST|nr:thioredoxin-like protein [Punctularia strigosozonata HHB-11173 SS5]EIN04376.1 thioredoxin-like protein [Punctularia strigosozonata HHB-11173 SS5]